MRSKAEYKDVVSVIVPVFNNPKGIEKVIGALVEQTYPKGLREVIIVDNGSTDDTVEVIERYCDAYPAMVRMVSETALQSSYAARNKGLGVARGDIFAFTDSDCVPRRDWIESGVRGLIAQGAVCGGGSITFTFKNERPNIYEYFDSSRKLRQRDYVERGGFAATANFFARKEVFKRYGEFERDMISGGDYEFGRRMLRVGEKVVYIPEAIVYHPARDTLGEIIKKARRIGIGQKELERRGLLEHGRTSWRTWLPTLHYPRNGEYSEGLSVLEKGQLIVLTNIIRYVNLWNRT